MEDVILLVIFLILSVFLKILLPLILCFLPAYILIVIINKALNGKIQKNVLILVYFTLVIVNIVSYFSWTKDYVGKNINKSSFIRQFNS
jgi:ABC-type multidrug transport system fused ATPase/permease subunit